MLGRYDFVIVGLENQASRGTYSRHSIGGRFVDYLVDDCDCHWNYQEDVAFAEIKIQEIKILVIKTLVRKLHECGEVLRPYLLDFADPKRIIIAYDEAELDLAQIELRTMPLLDVTQMGLKSLVRELGTAEFVRASIGIGSIPISKNRWDDFFNSELSADQQQLMVKQFPILQLAIAEYILHESMQSRVVDSVLMHKAQITGRKMNLSLFPDVIRINQADFEDIERKVRKLQRLISEISNKYAHACHDSNNPDSDPLVRLLESNVPKDMIPLIRKIGFHIDGMSFDIQNGKLVEINAGPMPPLTLMNLADGFSLAGIKLSVEAICQKVLSLANRGKGNILILQNIGQLEIGKTGWINEAQKYLQSKGAIVVIGSTGDMPNADVIWANLTWMTSDRIADVVNPNSNAAIYPSPRNFLFTNKGFLALLHDESAQEILGITDGYRKLIRDFVPKTFVLGETLANALLGSETRWYMKPMLASGSRGGGPLLHAKSHKSISRPAVIQEWVTPYQLGNAYQYDIRVMTYTNGTGSTNLSYMARVWYQTESLQRPMDALIVTN